MSTIGLVIKAETQNQKGVVDLANKLLSWAKEQGHNILLDESAKKILDHQYQFCKREELAQKADPIVVFGGDGTLIGVARYVQENSPVLIGVNFGKFGFLTHLNVEELFPTLEAVFNKTIKTEKRDLLYAVVIRCGKKVFEMQAVNDITVLRTPSDRLIELSLSIDDNDVMTTRADGLIIATPTGSTAYSLSAGGSIVAPTLSAILVTPICPHTLTNRPLVLDSKQKISVKLPQNQAQVSLSIDGQVSFSLEEHDIIEISESKNNIQFVRSPDKGYFQILRSKFGWGK